MSDVLLDMTDVSWEAPSVSPFLRLLGEPPSSLSGGRQLHHVSLRAEAGEVVALLGAQGAGRSTLLRIAAGLLKPSAGQVRIAGEDPFAIKGSPASVGLMMRDRQGFAEHVSVERNLRYFGRLHGLSGRALQERIDWAAEETSLQSILRKPWRRLYGGQRQRLLMARLLLGRPRVLLLDEPAAELEASSRSAFHDFLADYAREYGAAIVYATADMISAQFLSTRVALLDEGRLRASGSWMEVEPAAERSLLRSGQGGTP